MEIKQKIIEKLIKTFKRYREQAIRGRLKGFSLLQTDTGGKVVAARIKNSTGWYAIVCFYDCLEPIVDVYDMHVFDRYSERFMKNEKKDVIIRFIQRGNASGTLILKDEGRFEKRIKDGATLGSMKDGIIYHKTYLTEEMCRENKMDYLLEL